MTSLKISIASSKIKFPTTKHVTIFIAVFAGIIAIFARWYFVTRAQVMQPLDTEAVWGDAADYYHYAWNLAHHGLFSSDLPNAANPKPDSFRDPAYSAFLAICMMITGSYERWYALVLMAQAFMGGVTVVCATLAVRDSLPTWLLIIASLTMALWPHLISITAYVLSENLTSLLCAVTAFALGEAARRKSLFYTVVGGLALALAALTNAVLAPVVLPIALVFFWKRLLSRGHLLLFVVAVFVPLGAWAFRNSTIHGPLSSSFRAEVNLVQGSWPTYHAASQLSARSDPIGIETIKAIDLEIATLHTDRALGLKTIAERMSHAPGTYIAWYFSKPALLWGWEIALGSGDIYAYPTRNSPFITNPLFKFIEAVTFISNGLLAAFALAGLIIVANRPTPSAALVIFAVLATWVTIIYGILQSDARYSIPYRTAEIALAFVAISAMLNTTALRYDNLRHR